MLRGKVAASIVVAGVGACATLLLAAASGQAFVSIRCEHGFEFKHITVPLTVPPGATCGLFSDTVDGNISVGKGARFTAIGTLLKGKVSTEGAEGVNLINTEVDGNASFDATSGTSTFFCFGGALGDAVCLTSNKFFANVRITNTSPGEDVVVSNFVAENLTCTRNASVTNLGAVNMNTVLGQEFGQCVGL